MKIVVEDSTLIFTRTDSEWTASMPFLDERLHFYFEESVFQIAEVNDIKIDWKVIESFINHVLDNIKTIQSVGSQAIEQFQKCVHLNDVDYRKENGVFEINEIYLKDFIKMVDYDKVNNELVRYSFKYDAIFFFDRVNDYYESGIVEYPYSAQFSNHHSLTLLGVFNNIWRTKTTANSW